MSWGSYGLRLGPTPSPSAAPLFAAVPTRALALGDGQILLSERDTGRSRIVTVQVAQALELCAAFAPMDLHVQRVCASVSGLQGHEVAVRGVLEDLARQGALVSAESWLDALQAADTPAPPPLRTVIVRTCERAPQLAALFATLREHELRWRSGLRYLLVDRSRDAETVQRNRDTLEAFSAATGCHSVHVDRTRQQAWLDELCRALPERASGLRVLLGEGAAAPGFHGDYGISLNWIQLLGAGQRYAMLDDDHLFPLRWHPASGQGLDLVDQPDPPQVLDDLDSALDWGSEGEIDPFAAHAEVCGQPLAHLLRQAPMRLDSAQLQGLAPAQLPAFKADARVLASVHGHRGDASSLSLIWLLALPAAARPALLADPQRYRECLRRPAVVQVARRYRCLRSHGLSPFMLDGSRLLPAVPPRGRGEDGVFSALLKALQSNSLQVELPMAVGHRRPAAPERSELASTPATPALAQVLTDQLHELSPRLRSEDPLARLRAVCASLEEHAAGSDAELAGHLQAHLRAQRARVVAGLRLALHDRPVAPAHLATDLASLIEANGRALLDGAPARFAEWPEGIDAQAGAALWRGYVQEFAAALPAWPLALEVARERREHWLGAP
ncbi:hypothetical protein [Aquimonas voraii]|uniref:Uncharacterized protein n=1 Tax=Aquimonas voraii TaxID=265719 RepID=A0A1G6ZDI7_9GAMM|nr:hypothetical protein [Aquimonas voraii]SDE00660.1 hypothetical protein SAMN04488509_11369 [Aquimonas voraii]